MRQRKDGSRGRNPRWQADGWKNTLTWRGGNPIFGSESILSALLFMTNNMISSNSLYVLTAVVATAVLGQSLALAAATGETPAAEPDAHVRVIAADVNAVQGPLDTSFKECIGAGRANEGLRADWQDQLREVRRTCGFKYIRMHGLLTDDMGVYREDAHGNPIYNCNTLTGFMTSCSVLTSSRLLNFRSC